MQSNGSIVQSRYNSTDEWCNPDAIQPMNGAIHVQLNGAIQWINGEIHRNLSEIHQNPDEIHHNLSEIHQNQDEICRNLGEIGRQFTAIRVDLGLIHGNLWLFSKSNWNVRQEPGSGGRNASLSDLFLSVDSVSYGNFR
ncbi:hypothetical protein I4U23_031562 [Adineta vaga]|nr:hypothetical protein I4U23_031562 [Adineta vaga]